MKTSSPSRSSDPSSHPAAASVRQGVPQSHKTRHWLAAALMALLTPAMPLSAQTSASLSAPPAGEAAAKSIPFDQLGTEAQKQYTGDGLGITPTADGARLRAAFQDLAAEATPDGLWLQSTADEDAEKSARFRVRAVAVGREGGALFHLTDRGQVRATSEAAIYLRPGLIEEYTVSMDGVRQDFVLPQRPAGTGELRVELAVDGARAEAATDGAKLILAGSGREIAYSRLHVADANGRSLTARLEVTEAGRIQIRVCDSNASYPIRIDPTFSDADWSALGTGMNGKVYALAVSGSDLYVGGSFTTAGQVIANHIAKWNGSAWSSLGSGTNDNVNALAVSGTILYVGGVFTSVDGDGVSARCIAQWNVDTWSALGTGLDAVVQSVLALAVSGSDLYTAGSLTYDGSGRLGYIAHWSGDTWSMQDSFYGGSVFALAISGTDIYAGGSFTYVGGLEDVNYIAKRSGYVWSEMGSGMDDHVFALTVSGDDLYAGGRFSIAGGTSANKVAKWNGSAWSTLGAGMDYEVRSLALSGADLYAGGDFTTAGGVSASRIAKWNGSAWSALGSGMNSTVYALAVSDTGLYAGGLFTTVGGKPAAYIAKATMPEGPEIEVVYPENVQLTDGSGSVGFGPAPDGYSNPANIFTVRSTGTTNLSLSAVTTSGGNAGDFTVDTTGMATTVTPGNSTTFSVTFTPTGPGLRGTTLQIFSDDEDESPFDIALTGTGLSFTNDTDGDGFNDASEFQLAALGFNWDLKQTELVNTLFGNIGGAQENLNAAGYFTTSQVQALHIDTPLIQRDTAGLFTLTLGLQKSTTLLPGSFLPFPFTETGTGINAGKIEFQFSSEDDAAFFRLETD